MCKKKIISGLIINSTFLKLKTKNKMSDQLLKQYQKYRKKTRDFFFSRTSSLAKIAGTVTFLLYDLEGYFS